MNIVVGSITMPFSLSSKERLLWLENWIIASSEGLFMPDGKTIDIFFSYEKDINDTMKFLINKEELGWIYLSGNNMLSPCGTDVRFYYDPQSQELLNKYKIQR
tara:strand:+ start:12234 stop:12542 length:309 start_codon:yes stop_codon:yes gene_type:complete